MKRITDMTLNVVRKPNCLSSLSSTSGKITPDTPDPAQTIPKASPLRLSNHSDINKMEGLYAIQPPIPNPTPCDNIRCVRLEAKDAMAKEKHMMVSPSVENHLAIRGNRIIVTIANGQQRYATP